MGLLPKSARIEGSATVGGTELVGASPKVLNRVRGQRVAMIFQDPLSALNPVHRIGDQIVEMIRSHQDMSKKDGLGAVGRAARHRRHPPAADRAQPVPARVLRRHAPAGDDRHGDRQRPRGADRRRADDGARRHGAGADPRGAAADPAGDAHGDRADHPRPRRRRPRRRPGAGDVRRPGGRARRRPADLRPTRRTRTPRGCCRACRRSAASGCRRSRARRRTCSTRRRAAPSGPAARTPSTPAPRACPSCVPFGDLATACIRAGELADLRSAS